MDASRGHEFSAGLERVRRQFERWRRTHPIRSRIPDSLWAAAARAAEKWGINRTCRALRLDYYSLKERVEQRSAAVHQPSTVVPRPPRSAATFSSSAPSATTQQAPRALPTFFELGCPGPAGPCECTLEWESAAGAKMRIHLKDSPMPDLAALSRSFWNPAS